MPTSKPYPPAPRKGARLRLWRRRVRRHKRSLAWGAASLGLTLAVATVVKWAWAGPIPSHGGLYFPKRVELPVPLFAQGDPRWKSDLLGPTEATLHAEGCAVACAAMVLNSYGMDVDPGRLNAFLTENSGYTPQGWIYWEAAAEFAPGLAEKAYEDAPSHARIDWNLLRGNPTIIRIRRPEGTHFVVIAGKEGWDYLIQDPGTAGLRGMYPLRELSPQIEALRYYRKLR